jgi:sigma-B regulation protein RsbU (phosphoserine phosphatase)
MASEPLIPALRLRITSDPANLAPSRRDVEAFAARCGFDATSSGEIGLCVNEAMANITRHAYGGAGDRPVHLDADFDRGVLRVKLRDWGCGKLPPPQPVPKNPLEPGGIGMVCLRKLMDSTTFTPQPDGMLLTMERHV